MNIPVKTRETGIIIEINGLFDEASVYFLYYYKMITRKKDKSGNFYRYMIDSCLPDVRKKEER